ncbi:MAG: hypothetical protein AB1513_11425 [Pseudomonadota bacterium]
MTISLPTTPARDAAKAEQERIAVAVLELDIDRCTRTFGVSPCLATGEQCYNTYATCKYKSAYAKGTQTLKFIGRGAPIPAGETLRPYVLSESGASMLIEPEAGVARRNTLTLKLADEPDADVETDPYLSSRSVAAGGTFWARFMARNPNYVGRFARVRRGFAPLNGGAWDWTTFLDELYVIDQIKGPDASGVVAITLKDPLKLTDRAKLPAPTDGRLQADMKAVEASGNIVSATGTTAVLAASASAVDGAYVGMELYITANTGAGQRRTITAYAGASRTCTVSAWSVTPDTTSTYEVGALSLNLGSGKGTQYPDPATSGKREFIRIGEEVIEYTAKSGDVLSWPSTAYRAAFGTTKKDHKTNDNVQLCRAFIGQRVKDVVKALLNESGITDTYIDTAQLASEDNTWLGDAYLVTACLSEPEQPSALLAELCQQCNAVLWWSPATQEVEFKVMMPRPQTPPEWTDAANLIDGSVEVETLDSLRVTSEAVYFGLDNATANRREAKNYARGELAIDASAESAIEYGDKRPHVTYSRWFTAANTVAMRGLAIRRLNHLRDAPKLVKLRLDPKDYAVPPGEMVDLTTRHLVDAAGNPKKTRVLLTRTDDNGTHIEVEARTTPFARRYGFIAPNTTPGYPTDTVYAHFAGSSGLMSDGGEPYRII